MIARTVFRLGLAACFAGVSPLAMAQDVGKPEAQAAAAMEAATAVGAKPAAPAAQQASAPAQKPAELPAKSAAAHAAPLDPVPTAATPDPLTPPEPNGPAPKAPGAEQAKPVEAAQAPQAEPDPLATQILAHLAKAGARGDARDDIAGVSAYYTENKGQPIWISKEGFTQKAVKGHPRNP